jgi:hypothetical protein
MRNAPKNSAAAIKFILPLLNVATRKAHDEAVEVVPAHRDHRQIADRDEQTNQPAGHHHAAGEDRLAPRAGAPFHEARGFPVETEGHAEGGIYQEVDPQDLGRGEGLAASDVEQRRPEKGEHEGDQLDEDEPDVLVEVVVELAALLHRVDDRGEVVV